MKVGPGVYFDMIGGVQNAAWLNHDLDDDYLYDMYEGSDSDEYSYDGDNKIKTFSTLQDSSVIHRVSFRQDKNRLALCYAYCYTKDKTLHFLILNQFY